MLHPHGGPRLNLSIGRKILTPDHSSGISDNNLSIDRFN
jgi:hypothetical protein